MSEEFYLKAQALHAEFEKRELHYLKTTQKLKSNVMIKSDYDLPFHEYLQRINQKEKESEETYRNIMKHMEGMDKRVGVMSLQLQKLEIFRNSLTNTLPNWPSSIESNYHMFDNTEMFKSKLNYPQLESLGQNEKSVFQVSLTSTSTQTDNPVYCEKCHTVIHSQYKLALDSQSSLLNIQSRINTESLNIYTKPQEGSTVLNEAQYNSQSTTISRNNELLHVPESTDKSLYVGNSKTVEQQNEKSPQENDHFMKHISSEMSNQLENKFQSHENSIRKPCEVNNTLKGIVNSEHSSFQSHPESNKNLIEKSHGENIHSNEISSKRHNLFDNQSEFNKKLIEKPLEENINSSGISNENNLESDKNLNYSQGENIRGRSAEENSESKLSYTEANVDTFVSKSDAESMNNEFDFLESDSRIVSSEVKTNVDSRNLKPPLVKTDKESDTSLEESTHPPVQHNQKDNFYLNSRLELGDNISEISGSVSGAHSPNISVASDSDTSYEKDLPLTASAAYQNLRNAVIPQKSKREDSDSESDEVENAIKSGVQKSYVNLKPPKAKAAVEPKNKSQAVKPADPKPLMKSTKPPSSNKPSLSKNTKKILGLDTSSGSEVEVLKPLGKKMDDDDDEDFFD